MTNFKTEDPYECVICGVSSKDNKKEPDYLILGIFHKGLMLCKDCYPDEEVT
jgi:hypothetical protein